VQVIDQTKKGYPVLTFHPELDVLTPELYDKLIPQWVRESNPSLAGPSPIGSASEGSEGMIDYGSPKTN